VNNRSQPPQPAEPDMALLYLGSLFETLDYMLPPANSISYNPALRGEGIECNSIN
jgi:hypothetical protein